MQKVCPNCRMRNAGDAQTCAGCGESLAHVTPQDTRGGITMFGGPSQLSSLNPLEKATATPTESYGDAKRSVAAVFEQSHEEEREPQTGSTHRPRKPWE